VNRKTWELGSGTNVSPEAGLSKSAQKAGGGNLRQYWLHGLPTEYLNGVEKPEPCDDMTELSASADDSDVQKHTIGSQRRLRKLLYERSLFHRVLAKIRRTWVKLTGGLHYSSLGITAGPRS
jgi:hypothetical protein